MKPLENFRYAKAGVHSVHAPLAHAENRSGGPMSFGSRTGQRAKCGGVRLFRTQLSGGRNLINKGGNKMKLLSIAIPCYNSQDYMEKCIESLLVGGEEVEILVVDDGSSDRTAEIADA